MLIGLEAPDSQQIGRGGELARVLGYGHGLVASWRVLAQM